MSTKLEQLKAMTDVVADTGDVEAIRRYAPLDATTNPSLLLKAAALPQYADHLAQARTRAANLAADSHTQSALFCDTLAVLIGQEITQIVPGRVSTEVDARLSFDTEATVERAKSIIEQYANLGIPAERILIKIAATWEGIKAAEVLERANINCNLTLLFGFEQALACADAGVFLISPFVGRILDWYSNHTGETYTAKTDPGVLSVQRIYTYYKTHNYDTVVMGASFRNTGQIEALAGCDRLTISPNLMAELDADMGGLDRVLDPSQLKDSPNAVESSETGFRWGLNEDPMATEKLAEGIRKFAEDQVALEGYQITKLAS